ncbi:hypothetical protein [Inquilinus sp. OTU3971]|uniref:hypothetical protein n=1 Tax=Inquilinus sp. OTU3971 TaxID=3043855 RepID=UPI00313BAAE5
MGERRRKEAAAQQAKLDPILVHAEEYESAIIQALEAEADGSREAKIRAMRRYLDACRCVREMTTEDRTRADHHLQERGEIRPEDEREVNNALSRLNEELERQLDLFEDGPDAEPLDIHLHIFI